MHRGVDGLIIQPDLVKQLPPLFKVHKKLTNLFCQTILAAYYKNEN